MLIRYLDPAVPPNEDLKEPNRPLLTAPYMFCEELVVESQKAPSADQQRVLQKL